MRHAHKSQYYISCKNVKKPIFLTKMKFILNNINIRTLAKDTNEFDLLKNHLWVLFLGYLKNRQNKTNFLFKHINYMTFYSQILISLWENIYFGFSKTLSELIMTCHHESVDTPSVFNSCNKPNGSEINNIIILLLVFYFGNGYFKILQ